MATGQDDEAGDREQRDEVTADVIARDMTVWLQRWTEGDAAAGGDVLDAAYDALKGIARRHTGSGDRTLTPTALVHEACLRACTGVRPSWPHRGAFYRWMSKAMRATLVDHARRYVLAAKRGAGRQRVSFEVLLDQHADRPLSPAEFLDLDAAMRALADSDPDWAAALELRYFAGLELKEVAAALGRSRSKVIRDLRFAYMRLGVLLGDDRAAGQ